MDIAIIIVGIIFGAEVVRRLLSHRKEMRELELQHLNHTQLEQDNDQLRQSVSTLTARVEVLEKIVTDKSYRLNEEIESLK